MSTSDLFRCRRTVCMETGCQNIQLCSAILKVAFDPEVIGPLYFFPLLYMVFQIGEGLLLVLTFRVHERIKKPNGKCTCAPISLVLLLSKDLSVFYQDYVQVLIHWSLNCCCHALIKCKV